MRIIVTGGRDYRDDETVALILWALDQNVTLVHGDARGADQLVAAEAERQGFNDVEAHPADWTGPCRDTCNHGPRRNGCCPAAGNYRNQHMADLGADLCIAFPGGPGTADMCKRARAAGIPVLEVRA